MNRIRECFSAWQGELKGGAARFVGFRPQLATVSIDDGAAYRQPHAGSTGFRGVKGVEDSIEMPRINAPPRIPYGYEGAGKA